MKSLKRPKALHSGTEEVRAVLSRVMVLNLLVTAVKVAAWWSSGALSVAAEAMHSFLDALNNVFALAFARVAGQEPDEEHPYGHQKFEMLGALFLVVLLSITVFELVQGAFRRLTSDAPASVNATPLALGIMAFSVVAGSLVSMWESRKGRRLASDLLLADAAHTRSDVFASLAVLGGLLAVRLGVPRADAWITLAVAALVARTGWGILKDIVPVLVDERAVEAQRIQAVAARTEGVLSCYAVRSRGRPGEAFAELTIAVNPGLDVASSHRIADIVEVRVGEEVGAREVVVHVEPAFADASRPPGARLPGTHPPDTPPVGGSDATPPDARG